MSGGWAAFEARNGAAEGREGSRDAGSAEEDETDEPVASELGWDAFERDVLPRLSERDVVISVQMAAEGRAVAEGVDALLGKARGAGARCARLRVGGEEEERVEVAGLVGDVWLRVPAAGVSGVAGLHTVFAELSLKLALNAISTSASRGERGVEAEVG